MKLSDYLAYPLTITKGNDSGYTITIDGIPGAITESPDENGIEEWALACFLDFADFAFSRNRSIPVAQKAKNGQKTLNLPAIVALKVMLQNEMIAQGVTKAELARRIGASNSSVSQSLTLYRSNTKLDTLFLAFHALGLTPDIVISAT